MDRFFPLLALAGVAYYLYYLFQKKKKMMLEKDELFQAFAQKNGLQHYSTSQLTVSINNVSGKLDHLSFKLYEQLHGHVKSRYVITYTTIQPSSFDFEFSIVKKAFFNKGNAIGNKFQTGNPNFDKSFKVHTSNEGELASFLTPQLQAKLLEMSADFHGTIQNTGSTLSYQFHGSLLKKGNWNQYERIQTFLISLLRE